MGLSHSPSIVTDGLILCLDAANIRSYPGSGSTAYDLSGNSNNGTFVNNPSYTADYGGCFTFDGTNDRIETVNHTYQSNASWEAWVNRSSSVNVLNMFMGEQLPYFSLRSYGDVLFSTNIGGSQKSVTSNTNLNTDFSNNTWYHLVFTNSYNGTNTTMSIYVNGTFTNSASYAGQQVSYAQYKFSIGDGRNANWYQFNGMVTGVKVYNGKTLSADEVRRNYLATKSRFGL